MEAVQAKPRLSYHQQFQQPQAVDSFGLLVKRVMADVEANPAMRQYNARFKYHLKLLQRWPIGAKQASALRKTDFIEHCKERRKKV